MEGKSEHYYLRRKSGSPVGPFSKVVLTTMLTRGTLDGSEEISADRRSWRPLRELGSAPAAEAAAGFTAEGTEVLGARLGRLQPSLPLRLEPRAPADQTAADFDHGFGTNGSGQRAALDAVPQAVGEPESPEAAALELDADDLMPLELAPLELASPRPSNGAPAAREASGPVARLLPDADSLGFASAQAAGSMSLLPTIHGDESAETGFGPSGSSGAARPSLPGHTTRHRTMSAVRQRPVIAEAPKLSSKRKIIAGGAALLLVVGATTFVMLGKKGLLFGEPKVAAVLGEVAGEIDQDRFPAYEHGARLLTEAAATRPKSVRLRAAAAELLASSVVLRRADRTRIRKAESILAEITNVSEAPPALTRARGWIALGKGNLKDAGRLATAAVAAGDAEAGLLAGWVELSEGKAAEAAKTFAGAAAGSPARVALRYGLGRAQEEAGQTAAATATYRAAMAEAKAHFGLAMAVVRTGDFTPQVRLAQLQTLMTTLSPDASRTELADAQVMAGRAARLLGRLDDSDADYKRALATDPGDPAALVATGEALLEQGKMKEAIAKFEAAVPNPAAPPVAAPMKNLRYAMAAVSIEKGRPKPGLAWLEQAKAAAAKGTATAPDPRGLFWRARAAELASPPDTAGARRGYEETLKAEPRFLPATLQLAALLVEAHKGAEGLAVLRHAEAAGVPASGLQLALGQAFLASGDIPRATKTFRDALGVNPKLAPARLGLASALEAAGNSAAARTELETLLAQAPETPGLRQHLAELLVGQGQKELALTTYRAELASGRASPALKMAAAKLAFEIGHTDVAHEITDKLVAELPETPGALLLLGETRRAAGDLAGALADTRRALTFESTPELHFAYGRLLLETGNPEEASAELEQAPELPQAMIERARISLRRGDADRAVGPLEAAVKKAPGDGDGWLLLGNAYDRLGAPAKAEAAWKNAVKAAPGAPEPHYRLGRLQMDQGQPGPALAQLRLAAPKVPPSGPWTADFYFQLGFAEKARGTRPAATGALKKYLALAPSDAPSRHEVELLLGSWSL